MPTPPQIELTVAEGATGVSPVVPLEISVTDGEIAEASMGDRADVPEQGHTNVPRGCINLSTQHAAWFFELSQPGDVVEIRSSIAGDLRSDVYDWVIPWDQWGAVGALT